MLLKYMSVINMTSLPDSQPTLLHLGFCPQQSPEAAMSWVPAAIVKTMVNSQSSSSVQQEHLIQLTLPPC